MIWKVIFPFSKRKQTKEGYNHCHGNPSYNHWRCYNWDFCNKRGLQHHNQQSQLQPLPRQLLSPPAWKDSGHLRSPCGCPALIGHPRTIGAPGISCFRNFTGKQRVRTIHQQGLPNRDEILTTIYTTHSL